MKAQPTYDFSRWYTYRVDPDGTVLQVANDSQFTRTEAKLISKVYAGITCCHGTKEQRECAKCPYNQSKQDASCARRLRDDWKKSSQLRSEHMVFVPLRCKGVI